MPKSLRFGARGLWLNSNPLSDVPEGALAQADNVVVQRDGIVESRRGYAASADMAATTAPAGTDRAVTLLPYGDALLVHLNNGYLQRYDSGGAWTAQFGSPPDYLAAAPATGVHLRGAEALRRLYLPSDAGLLRLDDWGALAPAGIPRAADTYATPTGTGGWLAPDSQVAYRYHWTRKDARGVPMQGPVSGRAVATNPATSGVTTNVELIVPVPSAIADGDYLEVYRSAPSASADDSPGDDMAKVYEYVVTTADRAAGTLTLTDVVPEGLRSGATLYTSPNSGDGILADKDRPPLVRDVALYAGRLFGAYTTERGRLTLSFLTGAFVAGDFLTVRVTGPGGTGEYPIALPTWLGVSASQAIELSARNFATSVNNTLSLRDFVQARYISAEDDVPGTVVLESLVTGYTLHVVATMGGNNFAPRPAVRANIAAGGLVRAGTTVTATTVRPHGLAVGQTVEVETVAPDANFPAGTKTVASVPSATTFTYAEAGAAVASATAYTARDFALDLVASTTSEAPNGLAFSNADEPDAWPLVNRLYVGSAGADILRIAASQDALYVFKEDGVWRLAGNGPEDFAVRLFDGTVVLAAPSSVASVGGRLFALTNQGVVAVSETGVEVVSRPVESALLPLLANASSAVSAYAFGVSVEADREYRLYLPSSSADTYATQCYRYNLLTRAWTRTTEAATHGVVFQGRVHLGHPGDNALRVERRTYAASDYQDEGGTAIPVAVRWQVDAGGDAGSLKRWRTAALTFEAPAPAAVTLTFGTELAPGPATQALAPVAGVASCYVPQEQSRSATLTLGFTHATAGEKAAALGATVGFTPSSDRTGR